MRVYSEEEDAWVAYVVHALDSIFYVDMTFICAGGDIYSLFALPQHVASSWSG